MAYKLLRRFLLLLIFFSLAWSVCLAEGRMFRTIPNSNGIEITQATVYDIKRSDDGFVWFATDEGLIRFDGEHTLLAPNFGIWGGENAVVKSIAPFSGGLLVGTTSGVYRLSVSDGSYKVEPLLEGKPFSAACGITAANGDAIIGVDDGLVVYSPSTGETKQIKLSDNVLNLSNNVIDMTQSPNAVYVLTKGGVFRLDKATYAVSPVNALSDISTFSPTSLACSSDRLYIGTSGDGVLSLNPVDGHVAHTQFVVSGNVVTSLSVSNDMDALFIGTDGGGITKIDLHTGKATLYRHRAAGPVSPSSNQVYSLLSDSEGLLWVGYYQHGVDYTPASVGPFELFDNPLIFNSRGIPIRALSIDSLYNVVGTREGVVIHYKDNDEAWEVGSPNLRSEMVISLLNKNGKIFVGTYGGGMQVIDPKTRRVSDFALAREDAVFRNGHVFAIAADQDGGLWAGTSDGLYHFDSIGKESHYTSYLTALPEGNVYGIFFDSEGKGWICTDKGVCVYDPERKMLRTDLFPVAFPKDTRFRTVYEDSRKRLYFVPEAGYVYSCGLDFSNPQTLDYPLLKDSDAKGVVEDSFGNLWIATNRGVFRTDSTGHVMRFGLSAGLPSPSFLQAQPLPDGEGGIWFGNAEGLLRLDEKMMESTLGKKHLLMPTKVGINGKATEIIPTHNAETGEFRIELDEFANNVKMAFSTFSYAVEEPATYEYSIDGGTWTQFKNDLSVSLYGLNPGSHILRVRYADDSEMNDGETVVRIFYPYPLSWKIGFSVVAVLLIIAIWLAIRVHRHRKQLSKMVPSVEVATETPRQESEQQPQKKYVSNNLSRNEAREIAARIDELMRRDKPYLQSDLKVGKLAEMVGISSHKLSQFFSQHKGLSFYDYVNKFRVDEFKRMVKEEDVRNLTLSAMAEKAGFSSRASFFRYFKNIEGISPGEYLKNHQKD